MGSAGKTIILTGIDVVSGLDPVLGGVLQPLKVVIENLYKEKSPFDLEKIDEESVAALEMAQKVQGDSKELSSDVIYIEFNRSLDELEYDKFFDTKAITDAYSDCSVTMESLEMNDDWDGVEVFFEDPISELDIAKFSVFIDRYIKTIGTQLYVNAVYV